MSQLLTIMTLSVALFSVLGCIFMLMAITWIYKKIMKDRRVNCLSDFIKEFGNENVSIQTMNPNIERLSINDNDDFQITFGADPKHLEGLQSNAETAMIIWVDTDRYNNALRKFKGDE